MAACSSVRGLARSLLRRKDLASARSMDTPLQRCLSTLHLLFSGVAFSCGTGIFVMIGTVLRDKAGPASCISFLFCGIACYITSFSYMEFATLVPKAGNCYAYTYITLGELPAFIIGWSMIAESLIAISAAAKAFSGTVDSLTGHAITNFTMTHLGSLPPTEALSPTYDLVAVAVLTVIALVNMTGAMLSMTANMVMTAVQCGILLLIVACCFVYGSADNWHAGDGFFPYGFGGVLRGSSIAFFAICGFESIASIVEECKNPRKGIPPAFLGSVTITIILYTLVCLGLPYLVPYYAIDITSPFVAAFASSGAKWMAYVSSVGVFLALGVHQLTEMFVTARIMYSMGNDGLLFPLFKYVNSVVKVPLISVVAVWLASSLCSLLLSLETLVNIVSVSTLLLYIVVGIDSFVLRYFLLKDSDVKVSDGDLMPMRPWGERLTTGCFMFLRKPIVVKLLLVLYVIVCLLTGLVLNFVTSNFTWWSWSLTLVCVVSLLKLLALLCSYEPQRIDGVYESPLMPLTYLLTIFVNSLLIMWLPVSTWARFVIWLAVGLLLYGTYGFWHSAEATASREEYQQLSEETTQHQEQQEQSLANEKSPLNNRQQQQQSKTD